MQSFKSPTFLEFLVPEDKQTIFKVEMQTL